MKHAQPWLCATLGTRGCVSPGHATVRANKLTGAAVFAYNQASACDPMPGTQGAQAKLDPAYGMAKNHQLSFRSYAGLMMCSGVIAMNASRRYKSGMNRPLAARWMQ